MTCISKCVFSSLRRGRPSVLTTNTKGCWRRFSTTSKYEYDVVVIGGGPGGYVAAIKAAQLGLKSACIEKRGTLGGTCLNVGCIPSKAMLGISHKYYEARTHFEKMGISTGDVSIDIKKMQQYKQRTVIGLTQGIEFLFKKNKVDYLKGEGQLTDPYTINITPIDGGDVRTISAKNVILATGSEPAPLAGNALKVDERVVLTSTGALSLEKVPRHLIVVGGGVIGLELGSVWRKLGADVTVIEYNNRLIPSIDHEVCRAFHKILEREGIQFKFNMKVTGADVGVDSATLKLEDVKGGSMSTIEGDAVLLAVGRRPYTSGLGLEKLGIKLDERGRVVVDEKFCVPSHPHIRAIGDLIPGPMLAHKAEEEGIAVVEHIAGHGDPFVNHENIPAVIYTHPELAGVGKTEEQLIAENIPFKKGTFPFAANSRARANDETDGLVKVLSCKETDKILGAWILGPSAGELLSEIVLAMEYGAASEDLGRVCHSHPTLSEAVKEACMACYDKPIHFA